MFTGAKGTYKADEKLRFSVGPFVSVPLGSVYGSRRGLFVLSPET